MKPCPFCGSLRLSVKRDANYARIVCECGVMGPESKMTGCDVGHTSYTGARQAWDERPLEPIGHVQDADLDAAVVK